MALQKARERAKLKSKLKKKTKMNRTKRLKKCSNGKRGEEKHPKWTVWRARTTPRISRTPMKMIRKNSKTTMMKKSMRKTMFRTFPSAFLSLWKTPKTTNLKMKRILWILVSRMSKESS